MEVTNAKNPTTLDPNLLKAGYNGIDDTKVAAETKQAEAVPLLFGSNVLVSYGFTDVEALVAQLRNENADSRLSMKLKALSSIAQGLSSQQLAALEKSLALADSVKSLEKAVNDLQENVIKTEAELKVLQLQTEALEKQVETARENQKEYNKNIEKLQKDKAELDDKIAKLEAEGKAEDASEIAALKSSLAVVEKALKANVDGAAATDRKIADLETSLNGGKAKADSLSASIQRDTAEIDAKKNEISDKLGQAAVVLDSIDKNVLKTIAGELSKIVPEKAQSTREADKIEEKAEATDVVRVIRDMLDDIATDILDEIAERREQMV